MKRDYSLPLKAPKTRRVRCRRCLKQVYLREAAGTWWIGARSIWCGKDLLHDFPK